MLKKKKQIVLSVLFILSVILLIFLCIIIFDNAKIKNISFKNLENIISRDLSSPFSVNKIVYFSSANCTTSVNPNSSFTINNLYQYTDFAIFINNNSDGNFDSKNTLKKVDISNIEFILKPSLGAPNLYYKNINDFAKNTFDENNKIENSIEFETSSEDEIDFSKPILFNNLANPITLSYVNSNIKSDFTLMDTVSNISNDGSLLKTSLVTLNSISCKISMVITITNNLDEKFSCPIILTIPLSTENSTIYDGSLTLTNNVNYNFIKV